jgi:LysM repeat protein
MKVQERLAYTVRSGDSLWGIARSYGTTVDELRVANGLEGSRIFVGQLLDVPVDASERVAGQQ